MSLLQISNLQVAIKQRGNLKPVIRNVDVSVEPSQVYGLVGESGAGKSMVAKTILGLLPNSAKIIGGEISFNGQDLLRLSQSQRQKILGKDIALIPQDPMVSLNPVRTVGIQISDGLQLHLGYSKAEAKDRVLDLLNEVLIKDPTRVFDSYSHELSGGMRQRVLIAMAFSCEPKLIIADEPTTALDVTVQKRVLGLIRDLQTKQKTSLLFVTHDLGVVAKICDRIVVMYDGRVLEDSSASQLFKQPTHPYTAALLDAMPRFDQPEKPLLPVAEEIIQQLMMETSNHDARNNV